MELRRDKVELILLKLFNKGFRVFINAAITIPNMIVLKKNIIAYGTYRFFSISIPRVGSETSICRRKLLKRAYNCAKQQVIIQPNVINYIWTGDCFSGEIKITESESESIVLRAKLLHQQCCYCQRYR